MIAYSDLPVQDIPGDIASSHDKVQTSASRF